MQKVKLHLEVSPILGYLHHAYPLAVAQGHPSFQKWFSTSYIQLKFYPKTNWINFYRIEVGEGAVSFESCPLLEYQIIKNSVMKASKMDPINFFTGSIDLGYFVWIFIDEFYDPNRRSYHIKHMNHENLLYGYDLESGCFYTAGFDPQQNFSFSEIRFSDLLDAFNNVKDELPVKLIRPNEKANYEFDIVNVKDILKDYINSENSSIRNRMLKMPGSDCVYGMEIYKYLKLYLESLLKKISACDIRIFHIFWEHKKCMLSRIKYMHENNYLHYYDPILDTYNEIERQALTLRNQQFKYNLTGNIEEIKKMIAVLDEIKNNEGMVLTKLLECFK